jgi:hypothetical protein
MREVTPPMPTQELFVGVHMATGHLLSGDVAGGVRAVAWTYPFTVENPWFTGQAAVIEEFRATSLPALLRSTGA